MCDKKRSKPAEGDVPEPKGTVAIFAVCDTCHEEFVHIIRPDEHERRVAAIPTRCKNCRRTPHRKASLKRTLKKQDKKRRKKFSRRRQKAAKP